jgi:GTP-binding protein Era
MSYMDKIDKAKKHTSSPNIKKNKKLGAIKGEVDNKDEIIPVEAQKEKTTQKCTYIALMGAPNAGKSTLANAISGIKFSIVSPKVQTTRVSIKGICMVGDSQLVLIDTPGIFRPKKPLEKAIVAEAWRGVGEAECLVLVVDSSKGICKETADIIGTLKLRGLKAVLVLNKVDSVKLEKLLPLAKEMHEIGVFSKIFMISARQGDGVEDLKKYLAENAPDSPWMFPPDQLTDAPMRFLAAEITREKLFLNLDQELPYSVAVVTEGWKEGKGSTTIHQTIYVVKEGQKAIILGKGGELIKRIGQMSRRELTNIIGGKVNLFLFVKVRKNWTEYPNSFLDATLTSS